MNIFIFLLLSISVLSTSCKLNKKNDSDSDSTDVNSADVERQPTGVPIYASKGELPPCDAELDQSMVYVKKEKAFYTCENEAWASIDIKGAQGEPAPSISDLWRKNWKKNIISAAYIEAKYKNDTCERYDSGSGFIVGKNLVATNGHVAPVSISEIGCGDMDIEEVRVWYVEDAKGDTRHNARNSDAEVTKIDRSIASTDDTILLSVDTGNRAAVTLSGNDEATKNLEGDGVKLADEVLQIGFSGASTYAHFSTGRVTAIQLTDSGSSAGFLSSLVLDGLIADDKTIYEYDLISGAGSSGGALVNLIGEVIGINFAGNTNESDTEFGYAVRIRGLRELLQADRNWVAFD